LALSHNSPALFHQGLPARLRLVVAAVSATLLMQLDYHASMTQPLRQGINTVLYPVTELMMMPRDILIALGESLRSGQSLREEVTRIREQETARSETLLAIEKLREENDNLRGLLALQKSIPGASLAAEVRAARPAPVHDVVVIDRGSESGVQAGDPVINSSGVIGQVSRVFPLTSEVRLLSDKQLSVPVFLPRLGVRGLTRGITGEDAFELRHVNLAANIQIGDVIQTSGLDGLYPPGLPIGTVTSISESGLSPFPVVIGKPVASVAVTRQVLVLQGRGAKQ